MIKRHVLIVALSAGALLLAGCSDADPPPADASPTSSSTLPPAPTSTKPQTLEEKAKTEALEVYRGSWEAASRASEKPRNRDWRPELMKYFAEPALSTMLIDVKDYAKYPAHEEGRYGLSPKVTKVKSNSRRPHTVIIEDCIDASDVHVISDKAGEKGKNLDDPAQPHRYRSEARLAWYPKPKVWLVYQLEARLEEAC